MIFLRFSFPNLLSKFHDEKGGLSGKPIRDKSDEVLELIAIKTKGEITLILSAGKIKYQSLNKTKIVNKVKKFLKKYSLKDTVDLILETESVKKKDVYNICLKVKNEKNL